MARKKKRKKPSSAVRKRKKSSLRRKRSKGTKVLTMSRSQQKCVRRAIRKYTKSKAGKLKSARSKRTLLRKAGKYAINKCL